MSVVQRVTVRFDVRRPLLPSKRDYPTMLLGDEKLILKVPRGTNFSRLHTITFPN